MGTHKTTVRRSLLGAWVFIALATLGVPRQSHALTTLTLSGSLGQSGEVHPASGALSTNVLLTAGLGFVWDHIRPELGAVFGYGALRAHRGDSFKYELRPMLRLSLPVVPLYARLVVAGLNIFDHAAEIAYGGALGLNLGIKNVALFAEAGVLPRHIDREFHWIVEGRLGLALKL